MYLRPLKEHLIRVLLLHTSEIPDLSGIPNAMLYPTMEETVIPNYLLQFMSMDQLLRSSAILGASDLIALALCTGEPCDVTPTQLFELAETSGNYEVLINLLRGFSSKEKMGAGSGYFRVLPENMQIGQQRFLNICLLYTSPSPRDRS